MLDPRGDGAASACDGRPEGELLRKAAEQEGRARAAIEKQRQAVSGKRTELEAKLAKAEEALKAEKAMAEELHADVSLERWERQQEAGSLASIWPEVEEAAAAVRSTDAEVTGVRQHAEEQARIDRERLTLSSDLYHMYTAATGVHWDEASDGIRGYVAIDTAARPFDVEGLEKKAAIDAIWAEIEACLPSCPASIVAPLPLESEADVGKEVALGSVA
mmetsp:Transcript_52714/g.112768  ORF Transcript_52714/g.112768 Transcript_52714/m.112768 type:complete len:218 (-) Transcript_52714:76-729(-)